MSLSKVIVALDNLSSAEAFAIAEKLEKRVWGFKVNDLLLEHGVEIITKLTKYGKVFADPKLYDIPNTVGNSVRRIADAGASLITIHASGSTEMMEKAASESKGAEILAVTMLTSLSSRDSNDIYQREPKELVSHLALRAKESGVDGVVCSPEELETLKSNPSLVGLKLVTPGIRPAWYSTADDQTRVSTPSGALSMGAELLVIGRPITKSDDLEATLQKLEEEFE